MSPMPVAREEPYSRLATDRLGPRTVICEAVVRNDDMPLLAAASQCGCVVHHGQHVLYGQILQIALGNSYRGYSLR